MTHNDTPSPMLWNRVGTALIANTIDWRYALLTLTDGTAQLTVHRAGTRPSALAYKRQTYATPEHAKRAAARFERTFTHHNGHLRYRADPLKRVRGWYSDARYSLGFEDATAS